MSRAPMKLILRALALACLVLGASHVLFANGTGTLKLTGTGSNQMGGVYTYPYIFDFTPTGGKTISNLYLACDDFYDEISQGESWQVNETMLSNLSKTSPVYFNASVTGSFATTKTDYDEVAWLYQKMVGYQAAKNAEEVEDIQWAIWDIFDPNVPSSSYYKSIDSTDRGIIQNWVGEAKSGIVGGDFWNIIIYTPVNCTPGGKTAAGGGCPQEFVGVVPEPGTLVLLGTGLCSLLGLRRRFSR